MGRRGRRKKRDQPVLARLGAHGTGDRFGPLGEGWVLDGSLAELVAFHRATTPEALQRVLVIPGRRTDTMHTEAVWAFRRAHGDDDTGLVESTVLATTNYRWKTLARPLLEQLADELLDAGHVTHLVDCFLDADTIDVTVPGAWLVDFYAQKRAADFGRLDPARSYTLPRSISPQVRRWAAARCATTPGGIVRVLHRAQQLDSRHGAAALLGLVDVVDDLDDTDAMGVLEVASKWPSSSVRQPALEHLAARGHPDALDWAATDRAATIRRWAERRRQASLFEPPAASTEAEQQALFD